MSFQLEDQFEKWISEGVSSAEIAQKFLIRIREGKLTRDENPKSHLCVYFAAYDPSAQKVFIGHHKKSGLWLFNGGHIDEGESPEQALEREIGEEWGMSMSSTEIGNPLFLTITPIDNPTKQLCRAHYDIWYFVKVNRNDFEPDQAKLDKEFHQAKWVNTTEAKKLVTDPNTLEAIIKIGQLWK